MFSNFLNHESNTREILLLICHPINRFQREVYFLGNQLGSHHQGSGGKKVENRYRLQRIVKWTKIDSYISVILSQGYLIILTVYSIGTILCFDIQYRTAVEAFSKVYTGVNEEKLTSATCAGKNKVLYLSRFKCVSPHRCWPRSWFDL